MTELRYFLKSFYIILCLAIVSVSLGACTLAKNQATFDRSANKSLQDYRDLLEPRALPDKKQYPLPDFQPVVATPADLKLPSPLVTVSVNQTVSLRDLMFELSEQAGIDIEMDPQIHGSIIFTAKDKPFNNVIQRISDMAGLRYSFKNGVLRIELDRPYLKNYRMEYMGVTRSSSSSVNNSVSVSGAGGEGGGASSSGGSSASISGSYSSTFWSDVDAGLQQLLTASDTYLSLATLADPVAMPVAQPKPKRDPNDPTAPLPPPSKAPPTLRISTPAAAKLIKNVKATFSISKETGIISVFASERQQKLVKKFFDDIRKIAMTQVLIQAKVLEVSLSDDFSTGIDWGKIGLFGTRRSPSFLNATFPFTAPVNSTSTFTANVSLAGMLAPMISALSKYGTVRALSSPRVTVMNNQPAVVNMTRNKVYFSITTTVTPGSAVGVPAITVSTSIPKTAAEGILLNVLPTINPDTGEIILAIRPTISNISAMIVDPVNAGNSIPEMSVQEIDSIVRIQSGQTIVMGGLMKDVNNIGKEGIPILGDLPILGKLFSHQQDTIKKSELVILIEATIIPGSNADAMDRDLYNNFSMDRRPVHL